MKRKLYLLTAVALLTGITAFAQTDPSIKTGEKAAAAATTAAQQDVLETYLQIAAKSVTSTNSGLQIKLNWFSLNQAADKYAEPNYNKTYWQRNGEFVGFAGTKSWQAGFNFNLLNLSDTTKTRIEGRYALLQDQETTILANTLTDFKIQVLSAVKGPLDKLLTDLYNTGQPVTDLKTQIDAKIPGLLQGQQLDIRAVQILQTTLNDAITAHHPGVGLPTTLTTSLNETALTLTSQDVGTIINLYASGKLNNNNPFKGFITTAQFDAIQKSLDDQVKNNPVLKQQLNAASISAANEKIQEAYHDLVKKVARQPLLTLGYLYDHQIGTGTPYHQAGLAYLMSFGSGKSTHIGQLKGSLTDTLGGTRFTRNIVAFQAGYNQVLIVQNKTSLAEINGALEEDKATSGYISGTATSKFYFDAYIRARLPSTPWIKLDLKYDPKGGNVFGLLDFTYNFGQ